MAVRKALGLIMQIGFMLLVIASLASAEQYIKTGAVTAHESHGYIIKLVDQHEIVAVEENGKLYEFNKFWDKVDRYSENDKGKGTCTLNVKYKAGEAGGPMAWGFNALKSPILLEKNEKGYRRVDADFVTFPCVRR